jgi:hypothetical protein
MQVFCPTCNQRVTIADDLAGQATFCPACKAAMTAPVLPQMPNMSLDPTPPASMGAGLSASSHVTASLPTPSDPGKESPMSASITNPQSPAAPTITTPSPATQPSPSAGYARSAGFAISPEVTQWFAPATLALSLILTLFSWNGVFPGGHSAYTQSAWGALFGGHSYDPVADKVLKFEAAGEDRKPLGKLIHSNWLMLLYLPLLLAGVAFAVAAVLLPRLQIQLPPQAEQLIPWRMAAVAGVAFILTGLLALQMMRGFGLENAIVEEFDAKLQVERDAAKTPEEVTTFEIKRAIALDGLNVRQTTAVDLVLLLNVVAVFGAATTFLLQHRAQTPWPRVEVLW